MIVNRRTLVMAVAASSLVRAMPVSGQTLPPVHVVKDPGCPCCNAWIGHLRDNDFLVTFEERSVEALKIYKSEIGVPPDLVSCHTGTVEGYVLEGHVPAADILRLLEERPDAVGLAVPGMPSGSPGMGSEAERDAYDVILIERGSSSIFTSYAAA